MSSSRSRPQSWWHASTRCCAAWSGRSRIPTPLVVGEIGIDPVSREVTVRDEPVTLTQREFDLLLFMARHPHQAFSRNQLMDAVWQYSFYTDTSTVTVHIRRLRTKLERDPSHPRHLETVWGIGYRFAP